MCFFFFFNRFIVVAYLENFLTLFFWLPLTSFIVLFCFVFAAPGLSCGMPDPLVCSLWDLVP